MDHRGNPRLLLRAAGHSHGRHLQLAVNRANTTYHNYTMLRTSNMKHADPNSDLLVFVRAVESTFPGSPSEFFRVLQQAHLLETADLAAGKNQMIHDPATERICCGRQPSCRAAICLARRRIATRVVVGEYDASAAIESRVGDDRAQGEVGARLIAFVEREVEAMRLAIDMRDPQSFAGRVGVGEASGEEASRCFMSVDYQRGFGTLTSHGRMTKWSRRGQPVQPCPRWTDWRPLRLNKDRLVPVRAAYRDASRCGNIST